VRRVPAAPSGARGPPRATQRSSIGVRRMVEASLSMAARSALRGGPARRSGGKPGIHRAVRFLRCVVPPFWLSRSSPSPLRFRPRCASAFRAGRAATTTPRAPARTALAECARAAAPGRSPPAARRPGRPATPRIAGCIRRRPSSASPLWRRWRRLWSRRCSRLSTPSTPPSSAAVADGRRRPCGPALRRRPLRVRPARRRSRSEAPVLRLELQTPNRVRCADPERFQP
jgi:hypothetical protein